jgi:hypothetical protein
MGRAFYHKENFIMKERCMCGADDCQKCFPSHFNRCSIHGLYEKQFGYHDGELENCPKCEAEMWAGKEEE